MHKYHTGLLNISLLEAAAIPVGILAVFALHADTPLTARGSGTGTVEVSVTPTRLTSRAAGGLIMIGAVAGVIARSEELVRCYARTRVGRV
jgi:hypothetical protein